MLQYLHMENKNRYNKLNEYLKNKFGERTLKICIDAGFTCPNRDGTVAKGGCIFCSERGSGDHIHTSTSNFNSITEQVQNYFQAIKVKEPTNLLYTFKILQTHMTPSKT